MHPLNWCQIEALAAALIERQRLSAAEAVAVTEPVYRQLFRERARFDPPDESRGRSS